MGKPPITAATALWEIEEHSRIKELWSKHPLKPILKRMDKLISAFQLIRKMLVSITSRTESSFQSFQTIANQAWRDLWGRITTVLIRIQTTLTFARSVAQMILLPMQHPSRRSICSEIKWSNKPSQKFLKIHTIHKLQGITRNRHEIQMLLSEINRKFKAALFRAKKLLTKKDRKLLLPAAPSEAKPHSRQLQRPQKSKMMPIKLQIQPNKRANPQSVHWLHHQTKAILTLLPS